MERLLRNTTVLVTGGAGFIGSNLAESLLLQGNRVVCLDNFSTGKRKNIETFLHHPQFKLVEGDIRRYDDCVNALAGVEYVFHEAALGSVSRSVEDPVTSADVNIGGFVKMLFASKEAGVRRFIYASSSSVYGSHPGLPKTEERTGAPLSPYAITKSVNELYAQNFSDIYGLDVTGLRYFNVFGRRQDTESGYAAVIPRFIRALMNRTPPVIYGDGSFSRDFTYIDNVVQANHLAACADASAQGGIYNVAQGEQTSVEQLFFMIREMVSRFDSKAADITPRYEPQRAGDIPHSLASVEKIQRLLGYRPACNVYTGLSETVEWYRNNLQP
jgi:UDP-N-acetylglucosamine 4-epimerase